jgi:hypothetical protein
MIPSRRSLLSVVFTASALAPGIAIGADKSPTDRLEGKVFNVTMMLGEKKVRDKLSFTAKDVTWPAAGLTKAHYTATSGDAKHKSSVIFTIVTKAPDGSTITITGTASKNEVDGTIDQTLKSGETKSIPFAGGSDAPAKR